MDAAEDPFEGPVQQGADRAQVAPQRVGVGQQLRGPAQRQTRPRGIVVRAWWHHRYGHGYPFSDPLNRAETNCRWKIRKTMIVGVRITSEPADNSGISVAYWP